MLVPDARGDRRRHRALGAPADERARARGGCGSVTERGDVARASRRRSRLDTSMRSRDIESLDREITENKQSRRRARGAGACSPRRGSQAAALSAYRSSSAQLSSIVGSESALNAARRVRLIDHVNAHDQTIYRRLHTATKELNARRRALEADHEQQADALAQLQEQSSTRWSASSRSRSNRSRSRLRPQAVRERRGGRPGGHRARRRRRSRPRPNRETTAPSTTVPATTAPPPSAGRAPSLRPATSATRHAIRCTTTPSSRCVRARESGGNYSVVNPAGPYLGAYQFLQATWNASREPRRTHRTSSAFPRTLATPYDQDDIAWSLYQWRGAGPWGGGCP